MPKTPNVPPGPGGESAAAPAAAVARRADWPLLILVFTAGFVLMGFEIAGSRVLAPFFGNSIYVWGALIGIVLAALGLGYWWGGRVADRWPLRQLLGGIGIGAAAGVFAVPYIGPAVCQAVSGVFGEAGVLWGPVAASALLFLLPGILLGMVSPFAIRLQAQAVESLGRTAGLLYALSTIGSFAGTFVTTFVLIPWIGMSLILKVLGGAMMVASALTLGTGLRAAIPAACCLFVSAVWAVTPAPPALPPGAGSTLFEAETPYHHIYVADSAYGSRYLYFNRFVETQISLDPPDHRGLSEYTKFFHLAPAFAWPIRRACFIGAGGGVGPREFLQRYPGVKIDCVDIDPVVLEVCQRYFHVPRNHPDLAMIEADGRMFLRRKGAPYDAIVLDAFTIGGRIPFHLTTREYFGEIRDRLAPGGVLVMNVISGLEGEKGTMFRAVHRTMAEAFGDLPAPGAGAPAGARHVHVFDVHKWLGGGQSRNVIFVACRDAQAFEAAVARAKGLAGAGTLAESAVALLDNRLDRAPDPGAIRLTDDFAPVETMPF